jgi:hypothetical protein
MGMGYVVPRYTPTNAWAANVTIPRPRGVMTSELGARMRAALLDISGVDCYVSYVQSIASNPSFRQFLACEMRQCWWVLRNKGVCGPDRIHSAMVDLLFFDLCFRDARVDPDLLDRTAHCMSSGCVCDGCDLYNGNRHRQALPGDPH